jgi:hypothetical protein
VRPHRALVIQDVAAGPRVSLEHGVEYLTHSLSPNIYRGTVHVALDVWGEGDSWHG